MIVVMNFLVIETWWLNDVDSHAWSCQHQVADDHWSYNLQQKDCTIRLGNKLRYNICINPYYTNLKYKCNISRLGVCNGRFNISLVGAEDTNTLYHYLIWKLQESPRVWLLLISAFHYIFSGKKECNLFIIHFISQVCSFYL